MPGVDAHVGGQVDGSSGCGLVGSRAGVVVSSEDTAPALALGLVARDAYSYREHARTYCIQIQNVKAFFLPKKSTETHEYI